MWRPGHDGGECDDKAARGSSTRTPHLCGRHHQVGSNVTRRARPMRTGVGPGCPEGCRLTDRPAGKNSVSGLDGNEKNGRMGYLKWYLVARRRRRVVAGDAFVVLSANRRVVVRGRGRGRLAVVLMF